MCTYIKSEMLKNTKRNICFSCGVINCWHLIAFYSQALIRHLWALLYSGIFSRSKATILLSFLDNFHVGVVDLLFIVKKLQFQDGPQLLAIEKLYMTS